MIIKRIICLALAIIFLFSFTLVPVYAITATQRLSERIISETAVLMCADTGQLLFDKDMHRVMRPASITKVMTALLALEHADLDEPITVTRSALRNIGPTAAIVNLIPGERITLKDALYAIAVVSAADASNVIAEHVSGSVDAFISLMNERAKELGALNTNFTNAHGMPDDRHLTTAYDMALISIAAVNTPGFNEIFSAHRYTMPRTNMRSTPRTFRNLNRMMTGAFVYRDLISGKTGWTISSQYTLFTAAGRGDRTLVGILLRSPLIDDKYKDMTLMLNYGFDEFQKVTFTIEDIEGLFFSNEERRRQVEELTVYEEFSSLIPKTFTKNDVRVLFTIGNNEIANEDNEVSVRIAFMLNAPSYFPDYTRLGTLTAFAVLTEEDENEEITDQLTQPTENGTDPGYPDDTEITEDPNTSDDSNENNPEASEQDVTNPENSGTENIQHAGSDPQAENPVNENQFLKEFPLWSDILKDAWMILVLIIILLCFIVVKVRQRKKGKNQNSKQ